MLNVWTFDSVRMRDVFILWFGHWIKCSNIRHLLIFYRSVSCKILKYKKYMHHFLWGNLSKSYKILKFGFVCNTLYIQNKTQHFRDREHAINSLISEPSLLLFSAKPWQVTGQLLKMIGDLLVLCLLCVLWFQAFSVLSSESVCWSSKSFISNLSQHMFAC